MDQLLALRVFVRIAESGTFSKAADTLGIPKPTVTKLVQDLERHLGTRLLQRTTRRVSVTPEGAAYYERAARLIDDLQEMDELATKARSQPRGRLRVDVAASLATDVLIPALPDFRSRYPDIEIDLGIGDRPVDLIGDGVDCVIRGGPLGDTSLVARRIARLDYATCASPAYLRARGRPGHPSELPARASNAAGGAHAHAVVGYFSSLTGKAFPLHFHRGDEHLVVEAHTVVGVNEGTAHVSTLLNGLGIGQTLAFMTAPYLASGRLELVLPDWTRPAQPLHLVYPGNRHLNAKVRVFADWVAEVFAPFNG